MVKINPMILFYLSFLATSSVSNFNASTNEIVPVKQHAKEVIKVYPTPNNQGSITIHSSNEMALSFYLFDVEGNMIYQSVIKKNEKQQIQGLNKGTYIYNAFKDDQNLEGGKVEVK